MNPYIEFAGPVERFSRTAISSLQVTRKHDDETFVEDGPVDDRLDELAAEFVDRCRQGECPTIAEYVGRHPDLADEIRDVFPTVAQMEGLKAQIEIDQQSSAQRGLIAGHVPLTKLGDFRIIREIGRGGMGVVYEAEQMSLGRRVAIKALPLLSVGQPELVKRFQREARTAARLHHTNIVPVFGVGEAEGFHYYVMQLIDGIGLDTFTGDNASTPADSIASQAMTEFAGVVDAKPESLGEPSDSTRTSRAELDDSPALVRNRDSGEVAENCEANSRATDAAAPVHEANSLPLKTSMDDLMRDDSTSLSLPSHPKIPADDPEPNGTATDESATKDSAPRGSIDSLRGNVANSFGVGTPDGLTVRQIVDVGIQAAEALHYAHAQGTLHRDIKPGNLMLDANGVVWVTDFGLAKAMEGDDITQTENVVGTVRYMAPEQFRGMTDSRSDIYSLGLTLYELVIRKRAWSATSRSGLISEIIEGQLAPLRRLVPDVPCDLETIILTATARDVQHRYQSAGELAEDLRRFAHDRPILARRAGVIERLWRWGRRNPVVAALSVATTLSLMLFAVAAAVGYNAERDQRERAEATTELALEALDRIFEKFAPGDSLATSVTTLGEDGGPAVEHAVLSPEAARLLAGLLEFYERLASQSDGDAGLLLKCAQARQRVGDIYRRLGKYESAIESYRLAMSDFRQLARSGGEDPFVLPELVRAGLLNSIGSCELMLAEQQNSRESHQAAMALLDGLPDELQQRPEVRFEKARTHSLLARRLKPGESINSLQFVEAAPIDHRGSGFRPGSILPDEQDHRLRLRPSAPGGPGLSPHVPLPAERNGERQMHLAEAISLLEELLSEDSEVARYRFLLALCLREVSPSRDGSMTPPLIRSCRLLESLVEQYPERPEYRLALAGSYAHVEMAPERLRPEDAERVEASLAMAAEHASRLVEEHPTVPAYSNSLIHISSRLAGIQERRALDASGQEYRSLIAEAERNLRSAIELQESLVRREPEVATFHLWAARFRNSLARMLRQQGQMDGARQTLEYALERLSEFPTSTSHAAVCTQIRGQLYQNLGATLRSMDLVEEAVDAMLTAEECFEQAAAQRAQHVQKLNGSATAD